MWNVNTKVLPVILGENGTISESFRKYLSKIGRKYIKEILKNCHNQHCTHTDLQVQNLCHGK